MKSEELRASTRAIGPLYPILVDRTGNILDGRHRRAADPKWPVHVVGWIQTPLDGLKVRLHANLIRRKADPAEIKRILRGIWEETGWGAQKMAKELGIAYKTLIRYFPKELLDRRGRKRAGKGKRRDEFLTVRNSGFEPEITTLWDFGVCDPRFGASYPGRCMGQVVQNLLHLYTAENDLVVDPMAGSGTTLDVCREMNRRCIGFDLQQTRPDIRPADILRGVPLEDGVADLVFLDPPYGSAKENRYSDSGDDLANMDADRYLDSICTIAKETMRILKPSGIASLLMGAHNQGKRGRFRDLTIESVKRFEAEGFAPIERVAVVYHGTASATGVWVYRARRYRFLLRGFRDLVVFKRG